jgi:hypothetical protein
MYGKRLVDKATDDAEQSQRSLRELEKQHQSEMQQLRSQFSLFQSTQSGLIKSLESQLEESRRPAMGVGASIIPTAPTAHLLDSTSVASTDSNVIEDKLRRLEYSYKVKSLELETILQ